MSSIHNVRIVWHYVPDEAKTGLLAWLENLKARHIGNVTIYHKGKNGPITNIYVNVSHTTKTKLIARLSINAVKTV